jgi:hypothetical protein
MVRPRVRIRVPKDIRKMLLADEQVLLAVRQTRWKVLFTPDTMVATTQRVIRYSPSGFLGWHKEIENYRYEDMANFKITQGIIWATITIGHRFMNESLILDSLPKCQVNDISKVVEENISRARVGVMSLPVSLTQAQGALEVLKLRFARGDLTKEQFEEMRHALE